MTSENELQEDSNIAHESSSEDEVELHSHPSTSHIQVAQQVYMPYIEGHKMNWNVDDGLYNRFLKWKIKCENILECELAMLPEARKCKKVIVWSGDFGLDQYISWCLPQEELCLETIWKKFEELCKPQTKEFRARFDLLTSFCQGKISVDE